VNLTTNIHDLKQTKHNVLFLFQQGYSIVALPLTLFNFASVIYYLVIVNFPVISNVFPNFPTFLGVGIVVGPLTCIIVGLLYVKSRYYGANFEVNASANPYSYRLLPKDMILYSALLAICEKEGLTESAEKIRDIISQSQSVS
jgi:hypothetical protein